jgi:hypothetical protein
MSRFAASVDAAENPGIMSHGDSMHHDSGSNRESRLAVTAWSRVAIVTLCLMVHACDTGRGGAVELSWSLRPVPGAGTTQFTACHPDNRDAGWDIASIRLSWTLADGSCPAPACSQAWSCDDNHGATAFDVPRGIANLLVSPECSNGALPAPDTYIAPAIVQRNVIRGETVSLGAVELVVAISNCLQQPCICGTPSGN